jgi:integrase
MFKRFRKERQLTSQHVFTYRGKPMGTGEIGFNGTLKRTGINAFRFHDLRHTFASQMIMRGASLKDIQEILGHKTMTMTLRYAHLG